MASTGSHGLRNYVIRRLLLMVPTFLGVTMAVFFLTQFVPGGPIDQVIQRITQGAQGGEAGGGRSRTGSTLISEKDLLELKKYYGFDVSPPKRYIRYMSKLLRLDLGQSFRFSQPTASIIAQRLPISLYYGLVTTILTYVICVPLGIVKAIRHRTVLDNATSFVVFLGYAIPPFALGAVLLSLFAAKYGWFPLGGFKSAGYDELSAWGKTKDIVHHSILPLVCYMIGSFAFLTMLMKNSLMDNMSADYVKTALANGSSWKRAIFGHAMRNSLIPIATSFGNNIGLILTGALTIELVFNIQGMGLLFYECIQARDYPVVMGLTVISSLLLLVGNLLSDLCVALVDPRVRFQ